MPSYMRFRPFQAEIVAGGGRAYLDRHGRADVGAAQRGEYSGIEIFVGFALLQVYEIVSAEGRIVVEHSQHLVAVRHVRRFRSGLFDLRPVDSAPLDLEKRAGDVGFHGQILGRIACGGLRRGARCFRAGR